MCAPFIAIDYHPKVQGYLRMIDYEQAFQADVEQLDSKAYVAPRTDRQAKIAFSR